MQTIAKLDRTQQERADIETAAGRTYEVRFVVTHNGRDGLRTLSLGAQGRYTFDTANEAIAWIIAAKSVNGGDTLASVYGDADKLQVRACACYPGHHDPLGIYFDGDEENPDLFVAGVAFETWQLFNDSERHGVTFGLFPAGKTQAAEARLGDVRDRGRQLALKLMEIAASTPRGVSLASLSKVQRRRKAVARA